MVTDILFKTKNKNKNKNKTKQKTLHLKKWRETTYGKKGHFKFRNTGYVN